MGTSNECNCSSLFKLKHTLQDTCGQERFRTASYLLYRGSRGAVLAYNVGNAQSLENAQRIWKPTYTLNGGQDHALFLGMYSPSALGMPLTHVHCCLLPPLPTVGIQNGLDGGPAEPRAVSGEQGRTVAQELGVEWAEVDYSDSTQGMYAPVMITTPYGNNTLMCACGSGAAV
jgi:hypothetical protein